MNRERLIMYRERLIMYTQLFSALYHMGIPVDNSKDRRIWQNVFDRCNELWD